MCEGAAVTHRPTRLVGALVAGALFVSLCAAAAGADGLAGFDFTRSEVVAQWKRVKDLAPLAATPEGLRLAITGGDPHLVGPAVALPADADLWLRMRLRSDEGGSCQVFYYEAGTPPREARSVRFGVPPGGRWVERRVALPPLGPKTCFRIDPPGGGGEAVIAWMRLARRVSIEAPAWPTPVPPDLPADAPAVRSGDLTVRYSRVAQALPAGQASRATHAPGRATHAPGRATHAPGRANPGRLAVEVAGRPMAGGLLPMRIGYVHDGVVRWIPWEDGRRDPDGATWRLSQAFRPGRDGSVDVTVRVAVDRPREVVFLPMLMLVAGQGTFGTQKTQAVFAGLEYLADEPSSSEADISGPESNRRVPAARKITFPLMAVAAEGRYVGLIWQRDPRVAAVFDSPDRTFGAAGHVMGVVFPGADGENRDPGHIVPRWPERLEAGEPLVLHARLIGGRGETVVPAVEQYVRLCGLPPVPETGLDAAGYVRLAAAGWLDSDIRDGNRYRHAVWAKWQPRPTAGAALWQDYLATRTDAALAGRLRRAAAEALKPVGPSDYYRSAVSHVREPVVPLVYGHVAEAVRRAAQSARGAVRRFEPDGRLLYRQSRDKPDYASTHPSREASGLAARPVRDVLEAAIYCGDGDLVREGLRLLRALDRFAGTVPRGAQTWEIPLHTPDILAAAHLVRAYTLGYELTGEAHFLEQARYWAWTGVPFVYLSNPTDGAVGPYSTIPVLGATNWRAPVWFGRPVQWCGLVYADALYGLVRHEPEGPWKRLADGITAAGIQHTWKQDDRERQGLLPDFFDLQGQARAGPAINPGTVQANAIRLYGMTPVYDYAVLRKAGLYVHAPGRVQVLAESETGVSFSVEGWPKGPYYVLVSALAKPPAVRIGGTETPIADPHTYLDGGALVLRLEGTVRVDLRLGQP